jgi:hypothetical protein
MSGLRACSANAEMGRRKLAAEKRQKHYAQSNPRRLRSPRVSLCERLPRSCNSGVSSSRQSIHPSPGPQAYDRPAHDSCRPAWSGKAAEFPGWSCQNLAQEIGVSLDLVATNPAGKSLQLKVVAIFRVRRTPRYAHEVSAFRANRRVGCAKTGWHSEASLWLGENQPSTSDGVPD